MLKAMTIRGLTYKDSLDRQRWKLETRIREAPQAFVNSIEGRRLQMIYTIRKEICECNRVI